MKFPLTAILALPLTGCYPSSPARPVSPNFSPTIPVVSREIPTKAAPVTPVNPPRLVDREISGIQFQGVAFDSRDHDLLVADQADGPGSQYADSASAARSTGGIAAINAGFFTPEGVPLGLVVSSGKSSGAWNSSSSLGGGIWHKNSTGKMAISRRETLSRSGAFTMLELIQAGPFLVENGQPITGLENAKTSTRTLIFHDGGTRWWIGCTSPCTLANLSRTLSSSQPADWQVIHALNLDGGRSSDLWISGKIPGGPLTRRTPWNRPVRNFLILVAR